MELYFTRHARNRMRLYEISQEEVRAALEHAEEVTAGAFGRQTRGNGEFTDGGCV